MPSKSRGVRNHYIGLVTCIELVITVSAFLKTGKTLINNVKLSRTIPTWLQRGEIHFGDAEIFPETYSVKDCDVSSAPPVSWS